MSDGDLGGKTVLITGAAGGIGGALARQCLAAGAQVIATDIATPEETRGRIGADGDAALKTAKLDTGDRAAVEALATETGSVWALVDAAGLCLYVDWESDEFEEAFERTVHVNIRGPINLGRAFLPGMARAGGGRIVLLGSVAGWMGGLRAGPHYAFSKGGVHAYTKWLALRGAPDQVLVNAIAPGPVKTGMTAGQGYDESKMPLGRFASPDEIAAAAMFLIGPGGGYTTGAVLDVNGGTHWR